MKHQQQQPQLSNSNYNSSNNNNKHNSSSIQETPVQGKMNDKMMFQQKQKFNFFHRKEFRRIRMLSAVEAA